MNQTLIRLYDVVFWDSIRYEFVCSRVNASHRLVSERPYGVRVFPVAGYAEWK